MNNSYNYDKMNQDYTVKTQKDDAFESTIKEEKKRQKNIFAGNDIDYSKNMRYQQEKIKPSQDTMKVQSTLNDYGYTDQQGKKLKVDGAYGPKTDYAFNNAYNANKPIFENREKQRKRDEIVPFLSSAYDPLIQKANSRKLNMPKDEVVKTKQFLNQFGYTDMQDKPLVENDVWDDNTKFAFEKYVWDGIARQEVLDLQKSLNKNGITDKDGNKLLEDGKLGRKTDGAVHNALNTLGGTFDTEIKRGDLDAAMKRWIEAERRPFEKPNGDLLEVWGKGEKKGIPYPKPVPLLYRPNEPKTMTEEEKKAQMVEMIRKNLPRYNALKKGQIIPDVPKQTIGLPKNNTFDTKIEPMSNTYAVNSGVDNIANVTNYLNPVEDKQKNNLEINNLFAEKTLYPSEYSQKNSNPFNQPFEAINDEIQKTKNAYYSLGQKGQENISKNLESMGYKTNESSILSDIAAYARKNNIDNTTAIKRLEKMNSNQQPKSIYVGVRGIAETYGDISWDDSTNTANVALYDGSKFNFKQKDGNGTFIGSDGKMYVSALPNSNGVGYNLPSLSGDPSVDLMLYKALGERGYKEGDYNKNKYGDWYNSPNNPWCAQFVSWAAASVGIMDSVVGKFQHCAEGQRFYKSNDSFHYVANGDKPKAGDTFFMTTSGYPNGTGHTGLILAYTIENGEEIVYTIEGNAEDAVSVARRKLSDLYGFGSNGGTTNGIVPKNFDINRGGSTL